MAGVLVLSQRKEKINHWGEKDNVPSNSCRLGARAISRSNRKGLHKAFDKPKSCCCGAPDVLEGILGMGDVAFQDAIGSSEA